MPSSRYNTTPKHAFFMQEHFQIFILILSSIFRMVSIINDNNIARNTCQIGDVELSGFDNTYVWITAD